MSSTNFFFLSKTIAYFQKNFFRAKGRILTFTIFILINSACTSNPSSNSSSDGPSTVEEEVTEGDLVQTDPVPSPSPAEKNLNSSLDSSLTSSSELETEKASSNEIASASSQTDEKSIPVTSLPSETASSVAPPSLTSTAETLEQKSIGDETYSSNDQTSLTLQSPSDGDQKLDHSEEAKVSKTEAEKSVSKKKLARHPSSISDEDTQTSPSIPRTSKMRKSKADSSMNPDSPSLVSSNQNQVMNADPATTPPSQHAELASGNLPINQSLPSPLQTSDPIQSSNPMEHPQITVSESIASLQTKDEGKNSASLPNLKNDPSPLSTTTAPATTPSEVKSSSSQNSNLLFLLLAGLVGLVFVLFLKRR